MSGLANSGIKETKEALAYALEEIAELEQELEGCKDEWTSYEGMQDFIELKEQLLRSKANYFDLNSEFQQCLDCCKKVGELEAERDAAYNKGMERSVEILNSSSHREEAEYRIRKEIEK